MAVGYFKSAWRDITSSPGWMGKACLLALVSFIPVFGQIVLFGYLFGWARDIAWGVSGPLPSRIFGNEDGKLYSRGLFAWVISLICSLLPLAVEVLWMIPASGMALFGLGSHGYSPLLVFGMGGMVSTVLVVAATVAASLFWLVGSLRMSIYGRLGSGLQFGRIFSMIRHDAGGALRLVGMYVACAAVVVAAIVAVALVAMLLLAGLMIPVAGFSGLISGEWVAGLFVAGGVLLFFVPLMLLVVFVAEVLVVLMYALIVRAGGYWLQQFDVPAWRGQDDPTPFEVQAARAAAVVPPRPAVAPNPVPAPQPAPAPCPQPAPAPAPCPPPVPAPQPTSASIPQPPAAPSAPQAPAPCLQPAPALALDVAASAEPASAAEPEQLASAPALESQPSPSAAVPAAPAGGDDKPQP